jgi:predicted nucleotidyltransferase/uncharacterized protein with HEPN domain
MGNEELVQRLESVEKSLETLIKRTVSITSANDFTASDEGNSVFGSACWHLVLISVALKSIDRKTGKEFLARYPSVDWGKLMEMEDVIITKHADLKTEVIFDVAKKDAPEVLPIVRRMMDDLREKYRTTREYVDIVKSYKKENAGKYGIIRMGIFGSVARGEQTEESDLDIYVELKKPNLFIMVDIKDELEELLHCNVDIIHLGRSMGSTLKKSIERDGIYV